MNKKQRYLRKKITRSLLRLHPDWSKWYAKEQADILSMVIEIRENRKASFGDR